MQLNLRQIRLPEPDSTGLESDSSASSTVSRTMVLVRAIPLAHAAEPSAPALT